jgi:hypothetical protein
VGDALLPDAAEQPKLALMHQMREAGWSYDQVASMLNNRGWTTPERKPWTRQIVNKLLNTAAKRGAP